MGGATGATGATGAVGGATGAIGAVGGATGAPTLLDLMVGCSTDTGLPEVGDTTLPLIVEPTRELRPSEFTSGDYKAQKRTALDTNQTCVCVCVCICVCKCVIILLLVLQV